MKLRKNNLDEQQEQKLLKIESRGCWMAFWALLAAMIAQTLLGFEWQQVAGEWLIFMALALYLVIACARAGIWDRRLSMGWKTNLIVSLLAAACVFLFMFTYTYLRYRAPQGSLVSALISSAGCLLLCFLGLQIAAGITKKRQAALNAEPEEDLEE